MTLASIVTWSTVTGAPQTEGPGNPTPVNARTYISRLLVVSW